MRPALAILLAASCATVPAPAPTQAGPRGVRASEHLDAAREQDELARDQLAYPDVRSSGVWAFEEAPFAVPRASPAGTGAEHERLAQIHRGAAAQLQAEYDEACQGHAAADIAVSPLARFGIGGSPLPNGVVIYLSSDAGPADRLLADIRCHRAWMMLAPSDMDDCPLDLPDIQIAARGNQGAVEVRITASDPARVGELHRRAWREIERARHSAAQ